MATSINLQVKSDFDQASADLKKFSSQMSGPAKKAAQEYLNSYKTGQMDKFITRQDKARIATAATRGTVEATKKEYFAYRGEIERLIKRGLDPQDKALKPLIAKYDKLEKEVKEASAAQKKNSDQSRFGIKSFTDLAAAATAAYMGFKKVFSTLRKFEDAFFQQEKAVELLNASLQATGQFSESVSSDVQAFASKMQGLTVVGDEASLQLAQYAISAGLTADQSKKATKDAIALSSAFGVDLQAAIKATTNAQQGNFDMLNRYLPAVKNAKDETEKAAIAEKQLADAFKVAEAEAKTGVGTQQQYQNAIGDTQESVGELVSSAMTPLRRELVETVTAFNNSAEAQERFQDVAGDIASVVEGFITFKDSIFAIKENIDNAIESMGVFGEITKMIVGGPMKAMVDFAKLPFKGIKALIDNQQHHNEVLQAQWGYSQAIREEQEETLEIVEDISASETIIAEQLERQKAAIEDSYKSVRGDVLEVLKGEQTELDRLYESYERIAAHPWASGQLEDDRQKALALLREQMWEAAQTQTDWIEQWRQSEIDGVIAIEEAEKAALERRRENIQNFAATAMSIQTGVFNVLNQAYANQTSAIESEYSRRAELIRNNVKDEEKQAAMLEELEKEKAKKLYKIQLQQFRTQQAQSIIQATMNTYEAATKALAQGGFFGGPAFAAIIAGLGFAQVGLIASQKPPPPPTAQTGGTFEIPESRSTKTDNVGVMAGPGETVSVSPRGENAGMNMSTQIYLNEDAIFDTITRGIESGRIRITSDNIQGGIAV